MQTENSFVVFSSAAASSCGFQSIAKQITMTFEAGDINRLTGCTIIGRNSIRLVWHNIACFFVVHFGQRFFYSNHRFELLGSFADDVYGPAGHRDHHHTLLVKSKVDAYFSADVETDGPIPGPYSMLSFALVYAGTFDGKRFNRPAEYNEKLYLELKPISSNFQLEALRVNGLDRERLTVEGVAPDVAINKEEKWVAPKPSRDQRVEAIRRFTKRKVRACPHKPCFGCSMRSLCPVVQMFFWPDLVARA